jgi:hypothetical protein
MNEHDEDLVDRLQADWDALSAEERERIQRLRAARCRAHNAFDPIWQSGEMKRSEAYVWLGKQLGVRTYKAHIKRMDEAMCDRVIEICTRRAFADLVKP